METTGHVPHSSGSRTNAVRRKRSRPSAPCCKGARPASTLFTVSNAARRCVWPHGAATLIGALLDGGADVEARDSAEDTPLPRAVNCNKMESARLFLAPGADPHSKGSKALTPALAARGDPRKRLLGETKQFELDRDLFDFDSFSSARWLTERPVGSTSVLDGRTDYPGAGDGL